MLIRYTRHDRNLRRMKSLIGKCISRVVVTHLVTLSTRAISRSSEADKCGAHSVEIDC